MENNCGPHLTAHNTNPVNPARSSHALRCFNLFLCVRCTRAFRQNTILVKDDTPHLSQSLFNHSSNLINYPCLHLKNQKPSRGKRGRESFVLFSLFSLPSSLFLSESARFPLISQLFWESGARFPAGNAGRFVLHFLCLYIIL
jgi:hypothetical protein